MSRFEVFTDGSASVLGCKAGGYAAIILRDGDFEKMVWGGEADTTIGLMEMRAIIMALEFINKQPGWLQAEVKVFCDRQDVVYSATGVYRRKSNLEEWRRFDRAAKGLNLEINHIERNSNDYSAKCDELAGDIRILIEKNPQRVINSEQTGLPPLTSQ